VAKNAGCTHRSLLLLLVQGRMRVKVLKWRQVGVWRWKLGNDTDCTICGQPFDACW
jgi:hypothetical protein